MSHQFYPHTLPPATKKLVKVLQDQQPSWLNDFYLSGGTALSLQLGHRESEDLDFFSQQNFDPIVLQPKIEKLGHLNELELAADTLNTFVQGVKLQFLGYPYDLLEPTTDWQGIKLSSVIDIACTKLQTIGMRGSKKDFIDLYFLLKQFSLEKLFAKTDEKYQKVDFNKMHILKSLVYFDDAENQPMPRMHRSITWEEVKKSIIQNTSSFSL